MSWHNCIMRHDLSDALKRPILDIAKTGVDE